MYIVHVSIHVKDGKIDEFKEIALDNARHSLREAGVARFDVIQQTEDSTRFQLVEVYRSEEAAAQHKKTEHYNRWRVAVEPVLAEPRSRIVYGNVFPDEQGWG